MSAVPSETINHAPARLALQPAELALVRGILQQHAPDFAAWAFGSRARGRAKHYSDLDLALVGERPMPSAQLAALAEAFSESDLPWKVDLVDWQRTDAAFRAVIAQDRVLLLDASR